MASKKTEKRKAQKAGKLHIPPRGHQKGIKLSEDHKAKIQTSQILNRLNGFILSKKATMAPHQVTAALGLLKKVFPDLSAEHNTSGKEQSYEEWIDELTREGRIGKKAKQSTSVREGISENQDEE